MSKTTHTTQPPCYHRGLTLVELLVVLVILVALAGLIVPTFGGLGEDARDQATRATLSRVAQSIVGPSGYVELMRLARDADDEAFGLATGLPWPGPDEIGTRADHPQLHFLFRAPVNDATPDPDELLEYDPVSRIGWNGPWLDATAATTYAVDALNGFTEDFGLDGDLAPLDGWGNPVVIQLPDVTTGSVTDDELEHVRLVSAGRNGEIETPGNELAPTDLGDDVVFYLRRETP